jgi:tetratricopeptide (TPR) repeat protein
MGSWSRHLAGLALAGLLFLLANPVTAQNAALQDLLSGADSAYEKGDFGKAATIYDRAILSDANLIPAYVYARRASIYLFQGKYPEGLRFISDVAEKVYPAEPLILEQKAVILAKLPGKRAAAVALAETVVGKRSDAYTLHVMIGDFYYKRGSGFEDKAIAGYAAYLESRPASLTAADKLVRVKLGRLYLVRKDYAHAEEQFTRSLETSGDKKDAPIQLVARIGLCDTFGSQQKWGPAHAACAEAIRGTTAKQHPWAFYYAASAYLYRNQLELALGVASEFVAQLPAEPKGYVVRGRVYLGQKKYGEAELQLRRAIELVPKHPDAARWLGKLYLEQKPAQPKKAIDWLSLALSRYPDSIAVREDLATAHLVEGNLRDALEISEKALTLPGADKHVPLLLVAGAARSQSGEASLAYAHFARAVALKKTDPVARRGAIHSLHRMAAEKLRAQDPQGARTDLERALGYDPSSASTHKNLALVAFLRKEPSTALVHLEKAQGILPDDLLIQRLLGKAYLGIGQSDKAALHYAKAEILAQKENNTPLLAEIYLEWAPLLLAAHRGAEALEKLKLALRHAKGLAFAPAAARNLQLALFARGHQRLLARQFGAALDDLEQAMATTELLSPKERELYSFMLALAYLGNGQASRALHLLRPLAESQEPRDWLKPPLDRLGVPIYYGYALYREGSPGALAKAITVLEPLLQKTEGRPKEQVRSMLAATWELLALDQFTHEQDRQAQTSLKNALRYRASTDKPTALHNTAVLTASKNPQSARALFEKLADSLPEALVNLGIVYDQAGDVRRAYELWKTARSRGARLPELDAWIEAKAKFLDEAGIVPNPG